MNKIAYENLINELVNLGRPDFEIEEVGYFWNELVILKKEKMPFENISEEIDKFQRIVIDNALTAEDEEELFEDLSKKQLKRADLISYLKEESYYTDEEFELVNANIDIILKQKNSDKISEYDLFKFNAEEFKKALEEEKQAINYQKFDYREFLTSKIRDYDVTKDN